MREKDISAVREMVAATGFFNPEEVLISAELVIERLEKGEASGYEFIFMESAGKITGYSCYGRIPLTKYSYDLYWIVIDPEMQGKGHGKALLQETEADIRRRGGRTIYAETSSREQYLPTRSFYENNGYLLKTRFEDYYDDGDDLVYYLKRLKKTIEVSH